MSLKVSDVVASVRATLDYPDPGKLKQQLIILKLKEKVEHFFNRMNLTDRNWFLDSFVLSVDTSSDEYPVPAPQFGRPILVETQDLNDPQHVRVAVRIVDLQDRELFYQGTVQAIPPSTAPSTKHTATSFTFFSRGGQKWVKLTPTPAQSAEYLIWYEPNRPIPASFSGNLTFLDQFQNLLVTDLASTLIPYCRFDEPFNTQLATKLQRDLIAYTNTFEEYIQNDRQQRIEVKQLWGFPAFGDDWWL